MTAPGGLDLVVSALRRGVRVSWDSPPAYRGRADALALLKETPTTAREVLRRAGVFRAQIELCQGGGILAPVLSLPEAPEPADGRCIGCGDSLPPDRQWRCATCTVAVELALGLRPEPP